MSKATRAHVQGLRQACDACHFRKIRCLRVSAEGRAEPCKRCSREGMLCVFSPASKTGRPKKAAAGGRAGSDSTSEQSTSALPALPASQNGPTAIDDDPSIPRDDIDGGTICIPSADCSLQFDESFPELRNTDQPEVIVLKRIEQLSLFQRQLVAKRRQHFQLFQRQGLDASHGIQDILPATQKVTKFSTWLLMAGAKFAYRKPMLSSMTDETVLMMVVSPVTLVLDTFIDILEMAFPSLKDSSSTSNPEDSIAESEEGLSTIDPELLWNSTTVESCYGPPTALPDIRVVRDLANPVCVYILLTSCQEQLDVMRRAHDMALKKFPYMNSTIGAKGLLPAVMDDYLEKIRFVQEYVTRASGDNMMTGLV